MMKIDSKLGTTSKLMDGKTIMRGPVSSSASSTTASSPSAVRPSAVSSQLCGQGHEVTGWVLRGALFLQTVHIPFIKITHKVCILVYDYHLKTELFLSKIFLFERFFHVGR